MDNALRMTGSLEPRRRRTAGRLHDRQGARRRPDRSAFLILREAFYGTTRFDEFAERVGISEPVPPPASANWSDNGPARARGLPGPGTAHPPALQAHSKGRRLFPALVALMKWGGRWLDDQADRSSCATATAASRSRPSLRCAAGHARRTGPARPQRAPTDRREIEPARASPGPRTPRSGGAARIAEARASDSPAVTAHRASSATASSAGKTVVGRSRALTPSFSDQTLAPLLSRPWCGE